MKTQGWVEASQTQADIDGTDITATFSQEHNFQSTAIGEGHTYIDHFLLNSHAKTLFVHYQVRYDLATQGHAPIQLTLELDAFEDTVIEQKQRIQVPGFTPFTPQT